MHRQMRRQSSAQKALQRMRQNRPQMSVRLRLQMPLQSPPHLAEQMRPYVAPGRAGRGRWRCVGARRACVLWRVCSA